MTLNIASPKPVAKPKQARTLTSTEVHVVELKVTRKDNSGNLVGAVIDLTLGKAVIRQETTPITFNKASDLDDLIEFYQHVKSYLVNAPVGQTVLAYEAATAVEAEETTVEAAAKTV